MTSGESAPLEEKPRAGLLFYVGWIVGLLVWTAALVLAIPLSCISFTRLARTSSSFAFSGKGEVYSYTTIYDPPAGYETTAPYTVAIVKLEEGPMGTAQLTDLGEQSVEIGMPVEMVTRRLRSDGDERGDIVYGYKFRPVMHLAA